MRHFPNEYVGEKQIILGVTLALLSFFAFYKTLTVSPGEITKSNVKDYETKY